MADDEEQINTIFVTKKDDTQPILAYDISNALAVDLHVQFINFNLGIHHYELSVKDQNGQEKLDDNGTDIDFSKKTDLKINLSKNKGISETAFYIVMYGKELNGVTHLKISVTIDDKYTQSVILYTMMGGTNNG